MSKQISFISLLFAFLFLTACGGQQNIAAVTPIPLESLEISAVESLDTTATESESGGALASEIFQNNLATATPSSLIAPIATPTPLSIRLPDGEVLRMMMEQDAEMKPTPRAEYVVIEEELPLLYFWELFDGYDPDIGLIISDKAISLDGRQVVMQGFMAPPLQLDLSWFQLTLTPVGACPFCTSAETVLPDMVTVYPTQDSVLYSWEPVRVTGQLEVGAASDPETGMFSLVRLYADEVELGVTLE